MGLPSQTLFPDWENTLLEQGFEVTELRAVQTERFRERVVEISKNGVAVEFLVVEPGATRSARIFASMNVPAASTIFVDDLFTVLKAVKKEQRG